MLTDDVTYLKGIGPWRAEQLKKNGIATCGDLLYFFPRRYLDRTSVARIRSLRQGGEDVTIVGVIESIKMCRGRQRNWVEATLLDEYQGRISLIWFNAFRWIFRSIKTGMHVAVFGKVQRRRYGSGWQIVHPDVDRLEGGPKLSTGRIIALYPGSARLKQLGLTSLAFRRIIYNLIKERGLEMPREILPRPLVRDLDLLNWRVSVRAMHFPKSHEELNVARHRLKFEELFLMQLMLLLTRRRRVQRAAVDLSKGVDLVRRYIASLPFKLTNGQKNALADIVRDTGSGFQMNRLLQGDVGSGKTVVAVGALLLAVGSRCQGAIMAPTEVLAEQHYKTLIKQLEPLNVNLCLLKGKQRKKLRDMVLADIANGSAQIVVGTHAIFQGRVKFRRLGLVVIDEQHRFGVEQRATLQEKGEHPHVLLMTATPIPRSLALTSYGDLDLTLIKELPAGRKPITTKLYGEKRRSAMLNLIRREVAKGRQAYVVYPQVEESEKTDLKDAEGGHKQLKQEFSGFRVDLVHGKMASQEKDAVMRKFASGDTDILVATTVIEVGIDAPNATVIVIEHAERFGLSQLHQLRGRVGRGAHESYCILMADYRRTREAALRLRTLTRTNDGFEISDKDLEIRGSGDFFGTRQHGLPALKLADIVEDRQLIVDARSAAATLVDRDPELAEPQNGILRWYYNTIVVKTFGRLFRVG